MKNIKGRMFCVKPDKDEPKLTCGHPIPCPHHTVIIELEPKKRKGISKKLHNIKNALEE